jgi:polyferredoxin
MVSKLRFITQHLFFLVLTYGGHFGVRLGHALPCFACPYVAGCGGHCYLMALQGHIWGVGMAASDMLTAMGLEALLYLGLFILLAALLGKAWCGWICPFGTVQDWLTFLRRRLGVRESQLPWLTRDRLKPIKYLLLGYLLVIPLLIAHAGLHKDFGLPFCQICPAKPLMPLFAGTARHLALDFTNTITLVFSILSVTIAAGMLVGMFFKERFFCIFCPMLVLIHFLRAISPLRLEKDVDGCTGCGNCQRMCPMDIRDVHEEKIQADVRSEDCLLCLTCTEACPADGVLSLRFLKWRLFTSSRAYVARHFPRRKRLP